MSRPLLAPALADRLTSSGVPLSCAGCPLDLDPEADDYPPFEVDYDSQLLGTVSEFGRQVVIGTNKSDWIKEVTDLEGSLAGLLKQAWQEGTPKDSSSPGVFEARALLPPVGIEGVFKSVVRPSLDLAGLCLSEKVEEIPPRLSITNGSFIPSSHHGKTDSVMVFPDFTLVDVPVSEEGAETFEKHYLRDGVPRGGNHVLAEGEGSGEIEGGVRSWALPYRAVILICSHKRRDNRCHIAAPLLISQFHHHLESADLTIDERGDDISSGPPLETLPLSHRHSSLNESLQLSSTHSGIVGLFKVSHIGGHRYAGNVIIYLPNGTSVWYGRVRPGDVAGIVRETILGGKVIAELLRGGLGLEGKDGDEGVLGW